MVLFYNCNETGICHDVSHSWCVTVMSRLDVYAETCDAAGAAALTHTSAILITFSFPFTRLASPFMDVLLLRSINERVSLISSAADVYGRSSTFEQTRNNDTRANRKETVQWVLCEAVAH